MIFTIFISNPTIYFIRIILKMRVYHGTSGITVDTFERQHCELHDSELCSESWNLLAVLNSKTPFSWVINHTGNCEMAKRTATRELNHDNWDDEEEEEDFGHKRGGA